MIVEVKLQRPMAFTTTAYHL